MAGLRKGKQDGHAQRQHLHLRRDMTTSSRDAYEVHDYNFAQVACKLPVYDGKYDSAAYINWELAVEKQFDEYDFSNAQMIKAASNKCTGSASFWWHTVGNKLETWDECKILMRKRFVFSYYRRALLEKWEHLKQGDKTVREYFHDFKICITYSGLQESNENTMTRFFRGLNFNIQAGLVNVTYNHIGQLFMLACIVERKILENPTEQQDMLVPPITDVLQEVQKSLQNEKNDMFEMSLPSLANEEKADAATLSEESSQGKLNGAERNEGEYSQGELHLSTFHAIVEQPLVESIAELPLSQVDLLAVPCDKEELCDNVSLISMPQLVNEHVSSTISLCADSKHVVHITNEVEERELLSSLNTLGYVQFDDFCELDNLKEKLFDKSVLPCPTNAIFHIFGEYNDRGIFLVHRVYICSDLEHLVVPDKICKLERHVTANHIVSSLSCFNCKKQVVFSGLREEHHMEKPRTVFCEEGEDDVTMATMDTTIAHIMNQQEDIKIKSSMCCNLIRPRVTLLTSNGRQIYIRAPFWAREYLMESSRSPPSNGSSPISEFYLVSPQSQKQGIGLICTGKINNPRRGVSIAKAQHNVSYGCSRIVNVSPKS
uniref:Retrotransposon, putative, centromere-specific n=1 Tax=Oryza sativa subsp. japonica TaxID=39947 RepID=Q2QT88_ORYSJ|nr:retrotransposon, putative, centromere-specific [Oryza sativa Japonica Group]